MAWNLAYLGKCQVNIKQQYGIVIVCSGLLTGCGVGGMWMTGDPFPTKPKAYIDYWNKPGMTEDDRLQAWLACGGQRNGNFGYSTKKHQIAGETNSETEQRVENEFQICMLRAGYDYTGNCSDPQMKVQPLCSSKR